MIEEKNDSMPTVDAVHRTSEYSQTPETQKKKNSIVELIKFALIAALIVIPIRTFIAQPFIVSGNSMIPTFHDQEYLIVDELSFHMRDPHRGEVIVFKYPKDTSKYFIKRVIGLPGETLKFKGGEIIIVNEKYAEGIALDQSYIENKSKDTFEVTLKDDEYYVMGDNRIASSDSRAWGPLPRKYMVGRALIRVLPLSKIDYLPGHYITQE
jgi:signal peptidase I